MDAAGQVKLPTHLLINACDLAPGAEWKDETPVWKIVRLNTGFFYWIAHSQVHDLEPGDVLVIGPLGDGVLRASQICAGSIHYFYFRPEDLVGLMSLSERFAMETLAKVTAARIVTANEAAAREFAEIASMPMRRGFLQRCRMLHVIGMLFANEFPTVNTYRTAVATTSKRFQDIISRIPDSELINYSSEKLAELCGCSLRHLRRMFRKHLRTSVRAKQTELRLEKARQLLAETDGRIVSIAHHCGYRHLGLFNAMFKKRFGMTPSEWRRQSAFNGTAAPPLIEP